MNIIGNAMPLHTLLPSRNEPVQLWGELAADSKCAIARERNTHMPMPLHYTEWSKFDCHISEWGSIATETSGITSGQHVNVGQHLIMSV
jgi:hypothetical protein